MQLVLPDVHYKDSFLEALNEYQIDRADDRQDILALSYDALKTDFTRYVDTVRSQSFGENVKEGYVPQTTYWLIDNGEFIGRVTIRHRLTDYLLQEGGHIGYDIRPSKRQMGYGKKMLALALPKAKELGIERVLITCNETNIGSKKVIEANGGILENKVAVGSGNPAKLRYWISL